MDKPEPAAGKFVKIEWPEIGQSIYANNALVQSDEGVVLIGFYQINSPLLLGTADEQRAALDKIDTLKAAPIVRIAFPREKLEKLIEALHKQLQRHPQE